MKRRLNLMTEPAQFRVAARIAIRGWTLALAAAVTLLAPLTIWHWQECRRVRQEHEALEASYEPFKRLTLMNADLRSTAAALVRDDRLALELSRKRPVSTLLGIVSRAVDATAGALFVEHLEVSQTPPGDPAATQDRLVIDVVCTPQFDISMFTEALRQKPIAEVKVNSEDLIAESGVDAKHYVIECLLNAPVQKAVHGN